MKHDSYLKARWFVTEPHPTRTMTEQALMYKLEDKYEKS